MHVNVQRPECVTCACKCAESQTIGSQHILMDTSDIVLTAQLSNTSDSRIYMHVNVQWPVCLTCACKCAESQTIGSLHIFMHTSVIGLTAQLSNTSDSRITAHLHARIFACKGEVTRVSDVCM